MENEVESTEVTDIQLVKAEDLFSFREQIGRAESEARAQVAEQILATAKSLSYIVFAFVAAAMLIDQCNTVWGYYHYPIVTDELLGGLIVGIVVEIGLLSFCIGRVLFFTQQFENRK